MDSWSELSRIAATSSPATSSNNAEIPEISTLQFDSVQNLIWCGDSHGYARSFTLQPISNVINPYQQPYHLLPYTKFKASPGKHPILQHLNHKDGILSLLNNNINFNNRRGLSKLDLTSDSFDSTPETSPLFKNLTCMTTNSNTVNDIVVGTNLSLLKFDLNKPSHLTSFNVDGSISFVNHTSKYLTLGKSDGSIELFDPIGNESIKTFNGHNGFLSDIDVQGSYIATCGYSVRPRRYNNSSVDYIIDPLVNIYDVRMMRSLAPIPFPIGASSVRFHPKLPNIILISSNSGQIQFVDIYDQTNIYMYQADLTSTKPQTNPFMTNLEISENGDFFAFSDSYANLHLWSLTSSTVKDFVNFPAQIEQPDITIPPNMSHINVDDHIPLSSIGMPYYKDLLLSNWASDLSFTKELAKLPEELDYDLVVESEKKKIEEISNEREKDQRFNDQRFNDQRFNDQRFSDQRFNDQRFNDQRLNDQRFNDQRLNDQTPIQAPDRFDQFHSKLNSNQFMPYDKLKYGSRNILKSYQSLKERKNVNSSVNIPKFISERSGNLILTESVPTDEKISKDYIGLEANETESVFQYKISQTSHKIPNCYGKLQIQYSKFGIKDFDFSYYNKSNGLYCGLENHTDNSYINSLLQLYRFEPRFYNLIVKNLVKEWLPNDFNTILTNNNSQGSSILIELGYLFDMMNKSNDRNVKISNFSQVFNQNFDAKVENLINFNEGQSLNSRDLRSLIIKFNKLLIYQIDKDFREQEEGIEASGLNDNATKNSNKAHPTSPPTPSLASLIQIESEIEIKSNSSICNIHEIQPGVQFTLDLISPPSNVLKSNVPSRKNHNLLTYLEHSLTQYKTISCQHQYPHPLEVKTTITKLPSILSINLNLSNEEFKLINNFKKWLLPEFYSVKNSQNKITFKPVITQFNQDVVKYELLGYVCEINHQSDLSMGFHNLISYIKINGKWFLFNDFLVMPIPEEEVFNLSHPWKKPVVLMYQDEVNSGFDYFTQEKFQQISNLNDTILYRDHFAGSIRENYKKQYELLTRDEAPTMGSLVAIDAEFVTLKPEQLEVHFDGYKKLIKPKHLSLARISLIRGEGPKQGVAFIDDYIVHTCEIDDYLTSFSGIEPNDLDPIKSEKNLVTLQTAYRKLWLLLNLGVVFVGHGLYNDFRCINIQVPQSQIRDTADFYYKSDFKRQLGLKFLAYVLLKEKVQVGNHDSIEDAHTALLLYKKYQELVAMDEYENAIHYIYSEGQAMRFRVPE